MIWCLSLLCQICQYSLSIGVYFMKYVLGDEGLLKAFSIEITGKRPVAEAIITSGGIKVGEIDPKTMQSKKVPGLYFAGEVIDCDAYTGGFNLQIAWATAYAAGVSVGAAEKE